MIGRVLGYVRRLLGIPRGEAARQCGAIPWRRGAEGVEFLLITSRRTGRWIFPKGGQIEGLAPPASAAQEAHEEAGVEGEVAAESLGTYRSVKQRTTGEQPIEVEMYALEVKRVLEDWPEKGQRRRCWADPAEAVILLSEPDLEQMVRRVAASARAEPDRAED